jgi:predicted AAA+ superfamily ATPase
LKEEDFSFPVGRVEFLYLRPFSFIEYLEAATPFIAKRLSEFHFGNLRSELEHKELLKWVRRYLFIGGMPSAISASLKQDSLLDTQRIHSRILQAYESDFGKYAKHTQHKYLHAIFQKAPAQIAQILKYKNIDGEIRSRELKPALDLLCYSGILQKVFATTAAGIPLHAHAKQDRFKLLYLDVGLLQTAVKADATHFFEQEILQINGGMIAEQFVGQELLAYSLPFQNMPLLFWEPSCGGQAEIDFVISVQSEIIPIEVKAGATGSLRSLHSFLQERKGCRLGIRISEHPLSLRHNILSVPFYLLGFLDRLTAQAQRMVT